MPIDFIPFDELFAHSYQLTYITKYGDIYVGPYVYNVFEEYSVAERQFAFQACEKFLNWEISEIQEEWELCMYMYQWIIKSPPPFPYEQYTLSGEIINMATLLDLHQISQESGELFARFEAGMLYVSWGVIIEDSGTSNHANRIVLAKNILMNTSATSKKYFKYFLSNETIQNHIKNETTPTDGEIISAITDFYNAMANVEIL